ncbi:MAG: metal ABC transporter permease [Candidatus Krumholzibacteria bacterium]|nr:metal ABC transporter permease [Candidatus Krumholzibacteria bacterium]
MMILQYHFVLKALALCLILTGIHTYLGYHVVRRGIFFIDLSLAQVAALGSSVGVLLGWGHGLPVQNYLVSLAFTMLGALLFVLFRRSHERMPIEALIGITYAGAMALSLIVLERSASGTEEIKEMLAGSILTVSNRELLFIAALYSCVGLIHWIARRPLLLVTENPGEAKRRGMRLWSWDLVFYATFGFVVTSSVKVAGVLLVFAFLIIPAVAATVAVRGAARRIVFGWLFGVIGCIGGLELSLRLDWSPAPTIIATFLVLLVGTWGVRGRAGVD